MPLIGTLPAPSIVPICPYFYECGGCDMQDVPYAEQLAYKQASLEKLFETIKATWNPIIGSPDEYPIYFRNKMRFSFVMNNGRLWPSRHSKGSEEGDIPVNECFLQSPASNEVINWIADWGTAAAWQPYLPSSSIGWLKHVLIRQSQRTGEMILSIVTGEGEIPDVNAFADTLMKELPFVNGLYHTSTRGRDNFTFTDTHLRGTTHIHETIGANRFRIALHSFFQTNSAMVETLYDAIAREVEKSAPEMLWDLYAGSATIGTFVREKAKKVLCIESNFDNVADAQWNLEENKATNVTMIGGAVESSINSALISQHGRPDTIIADPPRAGLSEKSRTLIQGLQPKTVIYVSCNPLTLLRDLQDLEKRGFKVETIQGIDMFPHTLHCEAMAVITRQY